MTKLLLLNPRHKGDQAARRPHILCSVSCCQFGYLGRVVRLSMGSLHNQSMVLLYSLLNVSSIWVKYERGYPTASLQLWWSWASSGWFHLIEHPRAPISSRLTHIVSCHQFLGNLLAWFSDALPIRPDMMAITALHAITS